MNTIKFVAGTEANKYMEEWATLKNLLTREVFIKITPELAKKSNRFDDTSYIWVEVTPTIFEKFIITETGLNYTAQTVDVTRLLECWEALKFPLYINRDAFYLYKGWAMDPDVDGIAKNL